MLISCPKCHSIYEIPDDLIGKTGKNFRCQACANVWHALRSDALGYEEEKSDLLIEPLPVTEPPMRPWPANKEEFTVPADTKAGKKTPSSQEILSKEGDPGFTPPAPKKQPELTLTSDYGTSFTISIDPRYAEAEDKPEPVLYDRGSERLTVSSADHIAKAKPFKGYKKAYAVLFLLFLAAVAFFARREIVLVYPAAETYYQQIGLTGLDNAEYLRFDKITAAETEQGLTVTAVIYNDSPYMAIVPALTVSGTDKLFKAPRAKLKGHERTAVEIALPLPAGNAPLSLTLGFAKP